MDKEKSFKAGETIVFSSFDVENSNEEPVKNVSMETMTFNKVTEPEENLMKQIILFQNMKNLLKPKSFL